jgi:parallel beta-helix repeat protein
MLPLASSWNNPDRCGKPRRPGPASRPRAGGLAHPEGRAVFARAGDAGGTGWAVAPGVAPRRWPGARALLLGLLLLPPTVQADDWYVSPGGSPSGPGTVAQAYGLATALSGAVGRPGDTFWLTGGSYAIGHLNTQIQGAPGQPITFRPMPGQRVGVDGSLSFFGSAGYVVLRDFELFSSDTNRASTETNVGFNPTDINIIPGISSYSPNLSFINLVVHDETRHGIYISQAASNNLVYGCVIYNNGWRSPDNAEGHGIYVQGTNGGRSVLDNIVFNNSGIGMHIYENDTNHLYLSGIVLDGNVAFNAGAIQNVRAYRDWVVGVDAPAISADDIVFENNMAYFAPARGQDNEVQIGRDGINGNVTILNNYLPPGLQMNNWTTAAVAQNVMAAPYMNYAVTLNQTQIPLLAVWDGNTYGVPAASTGFLNSSNALDFLGWQSATGYDLNSTCGPRNLSGTRIFIRPNQYEPGRANLIVYNWDNQTNIAVDVSSVLAPGSLFEVRNAEDFFAAPLLSGVFDGRPLSLPMTGLTVAAPNGPMSAASPTGPTFNVFVLLPHPIQLQATAWNGQLLIISWPTNSGSWVLQSRPGLSADDLWADVPGDPVVAGDQLIFIEPIGSANQFFRLRSQ